MSTDEERAAVPRVPLAATEEDWNCVERLGVWLEGSPYRCILELRQRVEALEAMAKTVAMVVPTTGPTLVLPDDAFQSLEAAAAHPAPAAESAVWVGTAADVAPQLVPTTTADGLSPVEAAPKSQQGVTVEELAFILSEAPSGDLGMAYWLFKHRRIGPLLRGEGAPASKRVVLPEEPPDKDHPVWMNHREAYAWNCGRSSAWADLVTEMIRQQQGGQADG